MILASTTSTVLTVVAIVLAVILVVLIILSIIGSKMQKKQAASTEQMEAAAQVATILVIDKKRMKLKEAGLPKLIIDNTPKYLRGSKVPIVKAKIGPRVMTLMCDEQIFPVLPVKKSLKVKLSGIYLMDVLDKSKLENPQEKLGFMARTRLKLLKKSKDM